MSAGRDTSALFPAHILSEVGECHNKLNTRDGATNSIHSRLQMVVPQVRVGYVRSAIGQDQDSSRGALGFAFGIARTSDSSTSKRINLTSREKDSEGYCTR